jgi:hypothetical protein
VLGVGAIALHVPSKNRAAVIAFPGRKGPQQQARMLVRHGYGVLLFDRRGEGDSDGDPNALGWDGDRDVKAASTPRADKAARSSAGTSTSPPASPRTSGRSRRAATSAGSTPGLASTSAGSSPSSTRLS